MSGDGHSREAPPCLTSGRLARVVKGRLLVKAVAPESGVGWGAILHHRCLLSLLGLCCRRVEGGVVAVGLPSGSAAKSGGGDAPRQCCWMAATTDLPLRRCARTLREGTAGWLWGQQRWQSGTSWESVEKGAHQRFKDWKRLSDVVRRSTPLIAKTQMLSGPTRGRLCIAGQPPCVACLVCRSRGVRNTNEWVVQVQGFAREWIVKHVCCCV